MDRELLAKRLAFIETCLRELRTNARLEALETDTHIWVQKDVYKNVCSAPPTFC